MLTTALMGQGRQVMHLGTPGSAESALDREADFFGDPQSARTALHEAVQAFRPDWVLQVDDSTPLAHAGLESLSVPKAWYAVDTHLHLEWHRHYAPVFDRVFCAQQNRVRDLQTFRGDARDVAWLPLGATHTSAFTPWRDRIRDVSFVGTLDPVLNPERVSLVEGIQALGQIVHVARGDFRPIYPASKAVFNQSVRDDLNLRCFDAMAMGALLITDRISHSLEDIGIPGTDFLVYTRGDAQDLHAKISWVLEHPVEAEAIARRGQAKVMGGHMIGHRVAALLQALEAPVDRNAKAPSRGTVLAHLAAAHGHLSRLTLPMPLVSFFAGESRRLALEALKLPPDAPYALLTLAWLDFERGAPIEALSWLDRAAAFGTGEGRDEGYSRRYVTLRALALAHAGRLAEARQATLWGIRRFPGDADLGGIARALSVADPAAS